MIKQPQIAITGASGFLGSSLVEYFANQGWGVTGLVRMPPTKHRSNVNYQHYNIASTLNPKILKGVDYVVHAAYVKYDKQHPDAFNINVAGAKTLLDACRKAGVKKAIFISSMSAHDAATSVYGKQKLEIEQLFKKPSDTILKCGLIIGDGGIVKKMAKFMRSKHVVPVIGGGSQPLQIVAISDLVKVVEAALNGYHPGSYVIATPHTYSYKEFYEALARHIRTKVLYVPIPMGVLQVLFRMASLLHLPLEIGEENLHGLKMLRSMKSASDLRKLGINLKNLEEALQSTDI